MYVFNYYGQHTHTRHILTGRYMYNFTYNVFSAYGRVLEVRDGAANRISVARDYQLLPTAITTPNNHTCTLTLDNRRRLANFKVGWLSSRYAG